LAIHNSPLVDLVSLGPKAPSDLLPSIVANGFSAFVIILAMTLGLILPRMVIERSFPMDP